LYDGFTIVTVPVVPVLTAFQTDVIVAPPGRAR
jgi:hypothetical protein